MSAPRILQPQWDAPPRVRAAFTTRIGGVSRGPHASLNLSTRCGDVPEAVAENRRRLAAALELPGAPLWLEQVHGCTVVDADDLPDAATPVADAAVSRRHGVVLAVQVADCAPVLLCERDGTVVAVAHAGWRGCAGGVIERTVAAMGVAPARIRAWIGPCIGPDAFEVGPEVRDALCADDPGASACFVPADGDRLRADLAGLVARRLRAAGVSAITSGGSCTYRDAVRFYSYRRDGRCGRMAALVWIEQP